MGNPPSTPRSVRRKTTPVEAGAGLMRMFTGTPECRPTPEASTGRWRVVSNRKVLLPHLELLVHQARNGTTTIASRRTQQSNIVAKTLHFALPLWWNWALWVALPDTGVLPSRFPCPDATPSSRRY